MTDPCSDLVDAMEDASLDVPEPVERVDVDDVAFFTGLATGALGDLASLAIDSDDPHTVGRVLVALDGIAERLNGKRGDSIGHLGEVETHLLACLDGRAENAVEVGAFRLVRHWSKPRKAWKWDELFAALTPKVRESRRFVSTDGEVEDDTARAVRVLRSCLSLSAGKVTGLRELKIDPDEFCESGARVESIERQRHLTPVEPL